jgi:hypothetical protein
VDILLSAVDRRSSAVCTTCISGTSTGMTMWRARSDSLFSGRLNTRLSCSPLDQSLEILGENILPGAI